MKSIKEMLQIMLDNQQLFELGLCAWSYNLYFGRYITNEEQQLLYKYIKHNPPSPFSSLDALIHTPLSAFYWRRDNIKPRVKWIEKHIKLNS